VKPVEEMNEKRLAESSFEERQKERTMDIRSEETIKQVDDANIKALIDEMASTLKVGEKIVGVALGVVARENGKEIFSDPRSLKMALSRLIRLYKTAEAMLKYGVTNSAFLESEGTKVKGSVDVIPTGKVSVFRINRKVKPSIEVYNSEKQEVEAKRVTEAEVISRVLLPQAVSVAMEMSNDPFVTNGIRGEEIAPVVELVAKKISTDSEYAKAVKATGVTGTTVEELRAALSNQDAALQKVCQSMRVEYRATNPNGLMALSRRAQDTLMVVGTLGSLKNIAQQEGGVGKTAGEALKGLDFDKALNYLSEGRICSSIPAQALTHMLLPAVLAPFVKFLTMESIKPVYIQDMCPVDTEYACGQSAPKIPVTVTAPAYDQVLISLLAQSSEAGFFVHITRILPG
jgi:hypothetical protein